MYTRRKQKQQIQKTVCRFELWKNCEQALKWTLKCFQIICKGTFGIRWLCCSVEVLGCITCEFGLVKSWQSCVSWPWLHIGCTMLHSFALSTETKTYKNNTWTLCNTMITCPACSLTYPSWPFSCKCHTFAAMSCKIWDDVQEFIRIWFKKSNLPLRSSFYFHSFLGQSLHFRSELCMSLPASLPAEAKGFVDVCNLAFRPGEKGGAAVRNHTALWAAADVHS